MADAVATNVVYQGHLRYAIQMTCISDGTGESDVVKVDISTLTNTSGQTVTYTAIEEIEWDVQGFSSVELEWDHTTDDVAKLMSGRGSVSYRHLGYLFDPRTTGGTGDILLTSNGAAAGATYDITLVLQLR